MKFSTGFSTRISWTKRTNAEPPFRQLGDLGVLRGVRKASRRRARIRGFAPPAFVGFAFVAGVIALWKYHAVSRASNDPSPERSLETLPFLIPHHGNARTLNWGSPASKARMPDSVTGCLAFRYSSRDGDRREYFSATEEVL